MTGPAHARLTLTLPRHLNLIACAFAFTSFPGKAASLAPEIAGAHHGQAVAAAQICPGARLTPAAISLDGAYSGAQQVHFRAASEKIIAAWQSAFGCTDVDPAQTREINGCRRAKILSCTAAWREVGPEGTALPGLLEFQLNEETQP